MIKLLMISDHACATGFARVSESIAKYLSKDIYDISVLAVNYLGEPHEFPYKVYPAGSRGDIYGINRLEELCEKSKPDIIWILMDAWIQTGHLAKLKEIYKDKTLPKIVTYTPVDAKDHQPIWYDNFDIVDVPVAYTFFGFREIVQAAPKLADRLQVIQHGVDSDVFYKITDYNPREKVFPGKKIATDPDSFIVLNAGRNQPRKRLELTIKGFAIFSADKPDNVKLHLHSGPNDAAHINTISMSNRCGISGRLILSTTKNGIPNWPTNMLNELYNSCNVGINTGLGEGWGLPNIEHAVTGAAQVVPSHSACRELFNDCGVLIPTNTEYVLDNIMTTGYLVDPNDVANCLEYLYQNRDVMTKLGEAGRVKFTDKEFSWKYITSKWDAIFQDLYNGNNIS